uniref:Interleukin 10 receptor 2 transcript variant 3 n=1 Tax=Tupaia belangeri TaxID=37347 RepID=K0I6S6_TUPBE|nr:interleukin 10 receptor 2 transcript variant 3 [Tupaia belangeri]
MAWSLGSWLGCCLLVSALGMVPPPKNVRMNSVNFKNILQWESPAFPKGNLTFTAQYLSYRKFQDKCSGTALMECDFSSLSKYGDYILRVRAEFADEHSEWVNITFCPVDDTIIGPPRMQVEVVADSLHIRFLAPQIHYETTAWTMKSIYDSWVYNLQYWKNGTDEKFLGHPHHSILLLFPLSDENEVFDKLSVITEDSESNKRNSGDSSGLRPLSGQGPHKLVSAMDIHSADHSDPLLLTSA